MNNRYICKAKRKDNGEWVEGYYVCAELLDNSGYEHLIIEQSADGSSHKVIPETVRRCTSLKDKNGKLIFEGDVLRRKIKDKYVYYKVVFTEFNEQCNSCTEYIGFMAEMITCTSISSIQYLVRCGAEVIGNIHDNPELLKVER